MGKKVILILLEAPLPFGSAPSRWFYVLLKELKARGYDVETFVTSSRPDQIEKSKKVFPESEYKIHYYEFPKNRGLRGKVESLLYPHSFKFSKEMKRDLNAAYARGFDVLHIEQLWCGWVGYKQADKAVINIHHLQSIDLEDAPTKSWKEKLDFHLIFKTEERLVKKFKYFRSCSPRLVPMMKNWNPHAYYQTVPVGIDTSLYDYIPDSKRDNNKQISLIGDMGWYPGQSAAFRLLNRLWPEIKRRVPDAKLQIVGWSARSVLKDYIGQPGIEIHENVPEIQPYFEKTNVMLYAPARGSGMKIKVLEAMAFGIPLVTTSEGSEGLPVEDGVHMALCEEDEGLIDRTVSLLSDVEKQNRMRQAARDFVESHCGPKPTVDQIEEIYKKIIEG